MGLDAFVYCNCFETGKLNTPPRTEFDVYISEEGCLECGSSDLDTQIAFDTWRYKDACGHEDMTLLHHRIGNISLVSLLRQELNKQSEDFAITLSKIIFSGSHSGDYLTMHDIRELQCEMPFLKEFQCANTESQAFVDGLYSQLIELIECAIAVNKPIVF